MDFKTEISKITEHKKTYLEILKVHDKEVPIANLLAYFFRNNEKHGLGDLFIRALLDTKYYELERIENQKSAGRLISLLTKNREEEIIKNISDVRVITEEPTNKKNKDSSTDDSQKRIDILLETKGFVICIEFKIDHDLINPLEIYQNYIEEKYKETDKKILFIVLTPYRKDPEGKAKEYLNKKYSNKETVDFKQVVLGHFIDNVKDKYKIPDDKKKSNLIDSHIYCDFIQTIENRGTDTKIERLMNKYYKNSTTPFFSDISDFWNNKIAELNIKNLSKKSKSFKYIKSEKGGYIVVERKKYVLKIRIIKNKWQIERWPGITEKKDILGEFIDYETEYEDIITKINMF